MVDDDAQALAALLGVGQLVYTERCRRRMSQNELAHRSRVGQSTISRIEAGDVMPSMATLAALLAPLDLQPLVTAVPRWSDVDAATLRMAELSLEDRCEEEELWLHDLADAADAQVPLALGGSWALRLLGLPVRPRAFELVTSTVPVEVRQVLSWAVRQMMRAIDPRSQLAMDRMPDVAQLLEAGQVDTVWGSYRARISCDPHFRSSSTRRVRVFDFDVPVLSLDAVTSTDPWTRRVLSRAQGG